MPLATSTPTAQAKQRITGDKLNREWQLGARHALYHKDGTFYERLVRFPGVLCDAKGYVKYETKDEFECDSRLNIGVKVNVSGGLFAHPRYARFVSPRRQLSAGTRDRKTMEPSRLSSHD